MLEQWVLILCILLLEAKRQSIFPYHSKRWQGKATFSAGIPRSRSWMVGKESEWGGVLVTCVNVISLR